ncbi:zinc finger protein 391-like [Zerene cesonia]|uniref:zinc finger protein 391-like n=1 Tax=Zerene cesonia TaxID=33412 RepID=UPI0018E4FC15|nr:zinc finger protein 391-like [Zerene cesonia]
MLDPATSDGVDLKSCRICLTTKKPLCPLFRYKLSGNYAEMLTAIADVKVLPNDGLPEKICVKCCTSLEKAYLLKTVAERSDRKMRKIVASLKPSVNTKKIAFNSLTDIKDEIAPLVKSEPKWEMEIDVLSPNSIPNTDTIDCKDIVIANTVIRKVDNYDKKLLDHTENFDNDFFDDIGNDDDDDDYLPPLENTKSKFKKPKLSDIKVFNSKGKKTIIRKVKVVKHVKTLEMKNDSSCEDKKTTTITCFPILKNGSRGPPILLKRPKDATTLKVHQNFHQKNSNKSVGRCSKQVSSGKQREKMVCPVCGILTYTLGNHMATHEEKKKFNCSQCTRTFTHKSNLLIHLKQHSGIKDHICEVCGAGFYTQKSLIRHNLIHKGDRPFQCHLCSKKFIARCDLTRHLRIHAGYKPYKCTACTMSFNAKHQLQNHERMHTGERPYSCEVCNVSFSYKVNLNNHVFKTHGINLKFKSIHTVTEEVLRREMGMLNEARDAIAHIIPQLTDVPTPGAHETVHHTSDYNV